MDEAIWRLQVVLGTIHLQLQEVRGAGDARVVGTHQVLGGEGGLFLRQGNDLRSQGEQVIFDARQVLGGRRNDPGGLDAALIVNPVTVIEQTTRGLAGASAFPGFQLQLEMSRTCGGIGLDQRNGFYIKMDKFHGTCNQALVRIGNRQSDVVIRQGLFSEGQELVMVQVQAAERADQVMPAFAGMAVQGVRTADVFFDVTGFIFSDGQMAAPGGPDLAIDHGVFVGMMEGNELVINLQFRVGQGDGPVDGRLGGFEGPSQVRQECFERSRVRPAVEATDAGIDRMDGAPADDFQGSRCRSSSCAGRS